MPDVTLRRAAQIANAIQKKVDEIVPRKVEGEDRYGRRRREPAAKRPLAAIVTVDVDTASVKVVDELRIALTERRKTLFGLMGVHTHIRQDLAAANAKCGVSPLVTQRVMYLQYKKILEDMLQEVVGDLFEAEAIRAKIDAVRSRLASGGGALKVSMYGNDETGRSDQITVPIIGAAEQKSIESDLAMIARRLIEIDDQLVGINSTSRISITDEDFAILQNAGLA